MAKTKNMTLIRVVVLLITLIFVGTIGYFVSLLARGYQFDIGSLSFHENGILVAKSEPDGASIYIDGALRGATNTNLRLSPDTYFVEIKKNGHITWSKTLNIKKEEVTQVTAHLFKSAPSFSPVTFDGAENPVVSSDFSKIAYTNEDGLWIMSVSSLPIGFPNEPKKITDAIFVDSTLSFSPNNRELMIETKLGAVYLVSTNEFTPLNNLVNIALQKNEILNEWNLEKMKKQEAEFKTLPLEVAKILSENSSSYTFSPDENMVMYTASSEAKIEMDLISKLPGSSTQQESRDIKEGKTYVYDVKEDKNFEVNNNGRSLYWLPTSRHLILPDQGKIIIMDYDGTNRQTVFSGDYIDPHAYPFVNANKLLILTSLGSDSSLPNLYSLTIK
ncbi:MAG: PEGA domain-containing protein [bacterium]|nr:MAG: PEGA domain-containing protein [bacterium]